MRLDYAKAAAGNLRSAGLSGPVSPVCVHWNATADLPGPSRIESVFVMHVVSREQLPFEGMSHEYAGDDHGGVGISFFLVNAAPGQGPRLHKHPYEEIIIVQEGQARCVIGDEEREVRAGDIAVIPAGTPHRFVNTGDGPLARLIST